MSDEVKQGLALDGVDRGDREVVRLARGGSFSLACSVVAQAALLIVSIVLTNFLTKSDVGLYWQAHALSAIVSLFALGGMRSALTRFVAMYRADSDRASVHGAVRLGMATSLIGGIALGLVLYFSADWFAMSVFDDPRMVIPVKWASLILPGSVTMVAATSATQGFRNVRPFNVVRRLLEPGAKLAATALVLGLGGDVNDAMAVSAISTWVAATVAVLWLIKIMGRAGGKVTYNPRPLFRFALVSWGAAFAAQGLLWADILMIGWLRPSADVAVYQIASRVALFAALSIIPISTVLAGRLADLFQRDLKEDAAKVYQVAAGWGLRLTLPGVVVILVMPDTLLSVFGPGYVAGVATILILVPGQLYNASTGISATFLNMAGENMSTLVGNTLSLVINLGLNLLLIPKFGINGAAIAWSTSLLLVNSFQAIMVRRRIAPIWPWSATTWAALVAGGAATLVGLATRYLLFGDSTQAWTIVPIGFVTLVVYGAAIHFQGLTHEDRLLIDKFLPKSSSKPS